MAVVVQRILIDACQSRNISKSIILNLRDWTAALKLDYQQDLKK